MLAVTVLVDLHLGLEDSAEVLVVVLVEELQLDQPVVIIVQEVQGRTVVAPEDQELDRKFLLFVMKTLTTVMGLISSCTRLEMELTRKNKETLEETELKLKVVY